jgi:hypothetical protein
MGYFNKLEVSMHDDVDRLVTWYRAHADELPPYVLEWIVERDERLWALVQRWERQPAQPKPATEHVALQPQTRRDARALAQSAEVITFTKSDYRLLVGAVLAFGVTAIGLLLWIARLL